MRRLLVLAALAGAAYWLLRRRKASAPRASIGYADGSSVTLENGSRELELLVSVGRRALAT
jgi:hypothetical protein